MATDTKTRNKKLSGLLRASGLLSILVSSNAFALPCDFRNGDTFSEICGYINQSSSAQVGGQLDINVSTSQPNFTVHIRRAGNDNPQLLSQDFYGGSRYDFSGNSHTNLNWGLPYKVDVPSDWESGIYEVTLQNTSGSYPEFVAIRAAQPGTHSKILVLDSLPTKIAYSPIGGKSMYGFNSSNGRASANVSMNRPTGRGQWTEHREFVTWLDNKSIAYEAASMMDIHNDPTLLTHYNLVIMIGHNEYWSKEMRDAWDNYLASGGNGAIFSGNTMWWQIRLENGGNNMICYKDANSDPLHGVDNSRVTVNWFNSIVNRPENLSTGVSFRHGGYHNYTENGVQHYVQGGIGDTGANGGFTVQNANHWAFAGTGLSNGNVFGRGDSNSHAITGYEVDGALFTMQNGKPVVTGTDGTPTNFEIIATAPAYAVNSPSGTPGFVANTHQNQGWGTIGVFKPSSTSGTVFVAPTVDWAEGLRNAQVSRITENVINQLKNRAGSSDNGSGNSGGSSDNGSGNSGGSSDNGSGNSGGSSDNGSGNSGGSSDNGSGNSGGSSDNGDPEVNLKSSGGGSLPLLSLLLGTLALVAFRKR